MILLWQSKLHWRSAITDHFDIASESFFTFLILQCVSVDTFDELVDVVLSWWCLLDNRLVDLTCRAHPMQSFLDSKAIWHWWQSLVYWWCLLLLDDRIWYFSLAVDRRLIDLISWLNKSRGQFLRILEGIDIKEFLTLVWVSQSMCHW